MVRRLERKRLARLAPVNRLLLKPNQEWALTVIDSFTRESPVIAVNTGISGLQVLSYRFPTAYRLR